MSSEPREIRSMRHYWAEWDDTGEVVMWVGQQKFKLSVVEAEHLLRDLHAAVMFDRYEGGTK